MDRGKLLALVSERVSDRRMIKLLRSFLDSGCAGRGGIADPEIGTPQGGVASPLLANVYLTVLDRAIEAQGSRVRLIRYADDCVACVPTEAEAHAVLALIADVIGDLGLELHPDKTRIVGLDRGESFDFLGFHHQMVGSIRWRSGRRYLHTWPSAKAMNRARARIRSLTNRHMAYLSLEANVESLNLFLRGWGAYFRHGNFRRQVQPVGLVCSFTTGSPGNGATRPTRMGLVYSLPVAMAPSDRGPSSVGNGPMGLDACCTVKDVGEPCAIEPHARFDGGSWKRSGQAVETGGLR